MQHQEAQQALRLGMDPGQRGGGVRPKNMRQNLVCECCVREEEDDCDWGFSAPICHFDAATLKEHEHARVSRSLLTLRFYLHRGQSLTPRPKANCCLTAYIHAGFRRATTNKRLQALHVGVTRDKGGEQHVNRSVSLSNTRRRHPCP